MIFFFNFEKGNLLVFRQRRIKVKPGNHVWWSSQNDSTSNNRLSVRTKDFCFVFLLLDVHDSVIEEDVVGAADLLEQVLGDLLGAALHAVLLCAGIASHQ